MEGGEGGFVLDVAVAKTAGTAVETDAKLPGDIDAGIVKAVHIAAQNLPGGALLDLGQPAIVKGQGNGGGWNADIAERGVHHSVPVGFGFLDADVDFKAGGAHLARGVGHTVKQPRLPSPFAEGKVGAERGGNMNLL